MASLYRLGVASWGWTTTSPGGAALACMYWTMPRAELPDEPIRPSLHSCSTIQAQVS